MVTEDRIKEIITSSTDNSKLAIKQLKEFTISNHNELTNIIFDENDTCFCSINKRRKYKSKFIELLGENYI